MAHSAYDDGRLSQSQFEYRKLQELKNGKSLVVTIPTQFAKRMHLAKGDMLRMFLEPGDKALVSEKVELPAG
jgi:hypothetical protein